MRASISMVRIWLIVFCVLGCAAPSDALLVTLGRPDLERALAIARWPTSDADRVRFHKSYIFPIHDKPVEYAVLSAIEVITEFRRVELMAEDHVRLNDLWGRGGIQDVQDAIKPSRGLLTVVAHVKFLPTRTYIAGLPPIDVVVVGSDLKRVRFVRNAIYASTGNPGDGATLIGADIETTLDSASVGQSRRTVRAVWNGRELGCARIDFSALE